MFQEIFLRIFHKMVFSKVNSPRESFLKDVNVSQWIEGAKTPEEKAQRILLQMTLEEKIDFIGGYQWFAVRAIPRLGLDAMWMADATSGIRGVGESTVFPSVVSMAATWNPELIEKAAATLAEECRAKGIANLLAPGVNIARVPTCGRNFEYMGEDPFLATEISSAYIEGVQKNGVVATIKHFVANNSEYDRNKIGSDLDERTLREIYLPAFEGAVKKAGVWSVMSSYNPVNGVSASENRRILTDILKNEWGFRGFVVSDWLSCYDAEKPFNAGLDIEMPNAKYMNKKNLMKLLDKGRITETDLDDKVTRILTAFFAVGAYERPIVDKNAIENGPTHQKVAYDTAAEGIVLLKNENNTLPLESQGSMTIIVTGSRGKQFETGGGGSSRVISHHKISLVQALQERLAPKKSRVIYRSNPSAAALKKADAVIVCAGFPYYVEGEFHDRPWHLKSKDVKMILKAGTHQPNTIVVLNTGGAVETQRWSSSAAAIVDAFFPGDPSGAVVADVLLGKINPSAKLPFTFAKKWEDYSSVENYVSKPEKFGITRITGPAGSRFLRRLKKPFVYEEGVFVGYRHFDTAKIEPAFAFGHGLSYTTFQLTDLKLSSSTLNRGKNLTVSLSVTNTGSREGAEVVQLYVSDLKSTLPRPQQELKGFQKVFLKPGETKKVDMVITEEHLGFFNLNKHGWCTEAGDFQVAVGQSSRQIAATATFSLID